MRFAVAVDVAFQVGQVGGGDGREHGLQDGPADLEDGQVAQSGGRTAVKLKSSRSSPVLAVSASLTKRTAAALCFSALAVLRVSGADALRRPAVSSLATCGESRSTMTTLSVASTPS